LSESAFETYIKNINIRELLESLDVPNIDALVKEIKHFTLNEAEKRDSIVLGYFGETAINHIVDSIVDCMLSSPRLPANAKVLDVGAGSGFFTLRVMKKLLCTMPSLSFYAMDLTPAMLQVLARKSSEITLFLGVAENIAGSVEQARKYLAVPKKFDAAYSTLMLHHSLDPEKVFASMREALKMRGKAIVIDMCKHFFTEFREEMGDVHLGFETTSIEEMGKKHFKRVEVEKMPGIRCESSGRAAELFIAYMLP